MLRTGIITTYLSCDNLNAVVTKEDCRNVSTL
jgi:hypothetical protein